MNNVLDFALNVIGQNPQIANNPNAQQLITILRNNDAQQGQIVAQNLCKTYGITTEQAVAQAKQFFRIG